MNKVRYYVIEDLQGGEFAMGRNYTLEQWEKQALEWCFIDDNHELAEALYNNYKKFDTKTILNEIAEIWAIKFKKVRKDKKHFDKNDLTDYEDETLEEFYNRRFIYEE